MGTREDIIRACQEREKEVTRLLQAKAEKMADIYLVKHGHTQLSYLSREDREYYLSVPKVILLDKIISYLKSV